MTSQILIADQKTELRMELCEELLKGGHAVLQAADRDAAMDCIERIPLDLVIADAELPGLAGLDLLKVVRQRSPGTEVLLATECPCPEMAVSAFRSGAFDVIRKPVLVAQLVASANRALGTQMLRSVRAFHEAGQVLFSLKEPERLAAIIVELLSSVMEADVVSLMLPDAAGSLYIAHSRGLPQALKGSVRLPVGQRIAGRVAESRRPVLLRDKLSVDDRFADLENHGRVRSSIVYPLVSGAELLGVVNIGRTSSERPFGPHDLERAGVVASQVILALNNRRLWHQIGMSERLACVGQVAASIVHEINNPLAAIVGHSANAQLSLEDIRSALKRENVSSPEIAAALDGLGSSLAATEEAGNIIKAIASDVRTTVRQSPGGDDILDVNDAIRAAIRLASSTLRKSASVETKLDCGLLVDGDRGRLCQVFLNLLINAAQALKECPAPRSQIRIVSSKAGNEVRVDVSDNGPGIPTENLARIFEPFFTTKGPDAGSGLGLAICSDIVQRHGGRIEVESVEGQGTRFSVHLPALRPEV